MLASAEPLDRIAVIVGNQVIAESALLMDLRITAFLNQAPLDFSSTQKRAEAERLVDQLLIKKEADDSHLSLAGAEAPALLETFRVRYRSDGEYRTELQRYGITEDELIAHLQAGARAMAFTDLRFRQAAQISDGDLRAYYESLVASRPQASAASFEESRGQIEELLRGQRALDALDDWLKMARAAVHVEYSKKVFQ